jgi:hypothetical protein
MKKLIILAVFAFAGTASANSIGPAGCGLGNLMFGGNDTQVLAATTNGSSYTQLFGITSGTSNCTDGGGTAKLESFIEGNRVALATEAARGSGETISSLAQILNCTNTEKVGAALKSSHSEIFSTNNSSPAEVGQKVKAALSANKVLCLTQG